jgi:hypothetical protein
MRRTATVVGLLFLLGAAAYLYFFQKDLVTGLFKKGVQEVKGTGPAQTPSEAVDKVKHFVKARDYESASLYCGGTYGEQMKKGAEAARTLGVACDNLVSLAEKRGISLTDKSKAMMGRLNTQINPFPSDFEILEVKKENDDKAAAKLSHTGVTIQAEIKNEGPEKGWRVHFPVKNEAVLRKEVDRLNEKAKDYARSLEKIHDQIMDKTIYTKDDLEEKLSAELKLAGQ